MKNIAITTSNFKRMIEDHHYYVDKSMFISHVLRDEVSAFHRPRRFGKSMNMSMLYYFFSIKEKLMPIYLII